MAISDEQPPFDVDEKLAEYLARQFLAAQREDESKDQTERRTRLPDKVSIGKLYYFNAAIVADPDITQEGLYVYKSTGWQFIA